MSTQTQVNTKFNVSTTVKHSRLFHQISLEIEEERKRNVTSNGKRKPAKLNFEVKPNQINQTLNRIFKLTISWAYYALDNTQALLLLENRTKMLADEICKQYLNIIYILVVAFESVGKLNV